MSAELMDAQEYLARPVNPREQLIGGRLVVNEPRLIHEYVRTRLIVALSQWTGGLDGCGLVIGSQDLVLTDHDVVAPDVMWWSDPGIVDYSTNVQPVPDIAVEVRSPSTWRLDRTIKRELYEAHSVCEYWLVDADARAVRVLARSSPDGERFDADRLLAGDRDLTSPLLPGFAVRVATLFPEDN